GSRLRSLMSREGTAWKPAFQPYQGKPAVRNDRGDRGNVGIMRSPIRASILPDRHPCLDLPLDHLQLELGDGFGRVQALRAGLGAVHDGVAAVEPERVFEIV